MEVVFCESCRIGTNNVSIEEINSQMEKYNNNYICKYCENNVEIIKKSNGLVKGKYDTLMVGRTGIYHHDGLRRIMPVNTPFLGFGGAWFIIETIDETYLTNNLFKVSSLHPILMDSVPEDKIYIKNIRNITSEEAKEFMKAQELVIKLSNNNQ